MRRSEFSAKTKAEAFVRSTGHCESCTRRLYTGDIHYDHIVPDAIGGDTSLANCAVLCRSCHRTKTCRTDVPAIAKGKRVRLKHLGIKRKRGFRSWRRFDGTTVIADD